MWREGSVDPLIAEPCLFSERPQSIEHGQHERHGHGVASGRRIDAILGAALASATNKQVC